MPILFNEGGFNPGYIPNKSREEILRERFSKMEKDESRHVGSLQRYQALQKNKGVEENLPSEEVFNEAADEALKQFKEYTNNYAGSEEELYEYLKKFNTEIKKDDHILKFDCNSFDGGLEKFIIDTTLDSKKS